jgi:hypothetical protein
MAGTMSVEAPRWVGAEAAAVGRIVGIDPEGRPQVAIAGWGGPVRIAQTTLQLDATAAANLQALPPVALVFDQGDENRPVIIGWVHDRLIRDPGTPATASVETTRIDGERVVLRADREIELVCGASSIVLSKDGHLVIKGANLVSRSSGMNKIRGATVCIN